MKRYILFSLTVFMPILAVLASCATTEVKLENPETDYNKYPLVSGHNILKTEVSLNGYSLVLERSITKESDLPSVNLLNLIFGDKSTYSGGRFAVLKDSQKLCAVYIYQKSNMKKSGKQSMGSINRYILVERGKGDVSEYEVVNTLGSDLFLSVKENPGQIDFGYYREPGSKFGGMLTMNSAYKISVNGKPYGILTLKRNPSLYELKSAAPGDEKLKDAVMLWVLAAYEEQSMKSMQ